MAEKKGHRFPKGNTFGGRLPKEGFSDQEVMAIGEEMLQWMKDNDNKEIVHLSEFYSEVKGINKSYWRECIVRRTCFSLYWEQAREWMGKKLLKNKKLSPSYGNRFLPIYFDEVKENEREEMRAKIDYEVDKKLEALRNAQLSPNDSILTDLLKSIKDQDSNATKPETTSELQSIQ